MRANPAPMPSGLPPQVAHTLRQRCFWLFLALLAFIVLGPFAVTGATARALIDFVNAAILFVAIIAVGRSKAIRVTGALLAVATLAFEYAAGHGGRPVFLTVSQACAIAFYVLTVWHLVAYVFRRDVLTTDKLYGAAAAYLMLGVLWTYVYAMLLAYVPDALHGVRTMPYLAVDVVYFSFTVLTTAGFGDITPSSSLARMIVVLEQITGVLFVAILIARVAGIYAADPPAAASAEGAPHDRRR